MLELEPGWGDAACRLGEVRAADGALDAALAAWALAPYRPDCAEAAGRALLAAGRHADALERFVALQRLLSYEPWVELLIAQALAPTDASAASDAVQRFLARDASPHVELVPAVEAACDGLELMAAIDLVDRAIVAHPEVGPALAARRDALEIERRAEELMGSSSIALDADGRRALDAARARFHRGDAPGALADLERLADRSARSAEVWAALADLREAVGDVVGAERAIQLARRLSPLTGGYHARHAELLATHYAGRFDGDAATLLRRALDGEEDAERWFAYAELEANAGRWEAAREGWSRVVERFPGSPLAARAARRLADLDRPRAVEPELPAVPPPAGVPIDAWRATHRAWALRDRADVTRGDLERALAELDRALTLAPGLVKALNLRAQIHLLRGDREAAIASFRESLAAEPEQPAVMASLSDLIRLTGAVDEADRLLEDAARAGSPVALFRLAQRDARARRWWSAEARLDQYFEAASSGPVHADARALREQLRTTIRLFWAAVVATVLFVAVAPVVVWRRRRAGAPLSELLQRSPRAWRDVARWVSAIRHEVLKHSVSALPGVADALEDGDPEPARWAAARLLGPDGAIARFRGYVRELDALGRAHGVPLNLAVRDPVFAPMIDGFARLEAIARRWEVGGPRVVAELRAVSDRLNDDAYRALGDVLRGVCVVPLAPPVFEQALSEVLAEPALRGGGPPRWSLAGPTDLAVRATRGDLHDVLVNLLRNACEASREVGAERLGVRLAVEEDPITGIERVEIRICDDAPRRISTAMIRGRYIERGLGLAVDLTSRAGGSIHVEDEPGWSKAVVVKLPREEVG